MRVKIKIVKSSALENKREIMVKGIYAIELRTIHNYI